MAPARPILKLDTDNLTRGFVARNKLTNLGKEQDPIAAAGKVGELINWYGKEESSIRGYLTIRGVKIEDEGLLQQPKDQDQLGAESGSFVDLQKVAKDIEDTVAKLKECPNSGLEKIAATIFVRERSMKKGLEAYARAKGLDLGSWGGDGDIV
jgi:hypothetical protein